MPDKPLIGGTRWTQDGIDQSKAFWTEVKAYRDALVDLTRRIPDNDLRIEFLEILNKQGNAMTGLRDAIHELDVIGITAKRERLENGDLST